MEKNINIGMGLFDTLLIQIENNVNLIVDPIGKMNYAYRCVTNCMFEQYFEAPKIFFEQYKIVISTDLHLFTLACYRLLDDFGAASPEERDEEAYLSEPLNVYLIYYLYLLIYQVIDFFDELTATEVPVWYEV